VPAFRWRCPRPKPEKEFPYFLQGKPRLSGALDYREPKKHAVIVAALAVFSHWRRKNPDLLVITNGGGAQTKHARDVGNDQVLCHSER